MIRAELGDEEPMTSRTGDIDGFMTSLGRFVNRAEGAEIAIKANQAPRMGRALLSSDIDW